MLSRNFDSYSNSTPVGFNGYNITLPTLSPQYCKILQHFLKIEQELF